MKAGIVGGGIMGHTLALELIKAGNQVSIFDNTNSESAINCSMAAAGLLTPISELEKSDCLIYDLGNAALEQHWPSILADLDSNIYFQRTGSLLVSHPQDKVDLKRFIATIDSKFQSEKNNSLYHKLNQQEIAALEPELAKFSEAYYFPTEAHLDTQEMLTALKKYLCQHDITWYYTQVDEIKAGKIKINNEIKIFDTVFDCRGLAAKSFFPNLQGIRGELIHLHAPNVNIKRPIRFQHPRYSLYIVPRPNNIYLAGASEIHSENTHAISVRSTLEFLTAACYLHPGFVEASIQKTVTQCRPTFPDYLPKINYADGLVAVNGLYRHGFLLAPTLAAEIMHWLGGGLSALHYPQIGEFNDNANKQF